MAKAKPKGKRAGAPRKAAPKGKAPPTRTKEKRVAGRAPSRKTPPSTKRSPAKVRSPRKRVQAPRVSRKELERRLAAARASAARLEGSWMRGLERMREHLSDPIGRDLVLRAAKPPPATKGTPWALIARFAGWDAQAGYTELHLGLKATEGDRQIEREIGAQRLCRIAVRYEGVAERGGRKRVEREFTLANIAPWEVAISRAVERTDPGVEDSLVAHYDHDDTRTLIRAVYVWISADVATEVEL